ncbi:MAG: tRNA modification GTPase TrmE [Planctomycetota bacterium]|nr:MAG: tRNA modification GTPase TrmE [Planctomycetota bacterium]
MPARSLTAAVWTPSGRGAVATIRVHGDLATLSEGIAEIFQAASGRPLDETPQQRIGFGQWRRDAVEDVVVCRTGPAACEIHCHGGDAAVRRILCDLQEFGCEIVDWRDQLERERGVWEREHADALSRATTLRAAGWIAAQAGRMDRAIAELNNLVSNGQHGFAIERAKEMLSWADFGRHLTRPWDVVLAGRPNVGKSSLINALVGFERSIVFDEPGTTRDVVTAATVLDGWAIRLSDTAGQHGSARDLEAAGIECAREAFAKANARLLLIDISEPPHDDDQRLLGEWPDAIVVAHKADLPDAWGESLPANAFRVSSLQRTGLIELSSAIVRHVVPELPSADMTIPLTELQFYELVQFL